jgi:hypothetical protein
VKELDSHPNNVELENLWTISTDRSSIAGYLMTIKRISWCFSKARILG